MAEKVQEVLDSFVESLRALGQQNLLRPEEIHKVVQRRREYEYSIAARRQARLVDFQNYLQDERNLMKLCQIRAKQRKINNNNNSNNIIYTAIQKHIHLIWTRLLRKFKRVDLYLQCIQYCRQECPQEVNRLKQIYTQALQLFPKSVELWCEAAFHIEWKHNHSAQNARILFQRALRVIPTSVELWAHAFRLEMEFQHLFQPKKTAKGEKRKETEPENHHEDSNTASSLHKVAQIVYDNAVSKMDMNVETRCLFYEIAQEFQNEPMATYIFNDILTVEKDPQCWILQLQREFQQHKVKERPWKKPKSSATQQPNEHQSRVRALIEKAIQRVPTLSMYHRIMECLIENQNEVAKQQENNDLLIHTLFQQALKLPSSPPTEDEESFLLQYLQYVYPRSKEKAQSIMQEWMNRGVDDNQACVSSSSSLLLSFSSHVWITWAQLEEKDTDKQLQIVQQGLNAWSTQASSSIHHRNLLLAVMAIQINRGIRYERLLELLDPLLLLFATTTKDEATSSLSFVNPFCESLSTLPQACVSVLRKAYQDAGWMGAQAVYARVLSSSALSCYRFDESMLEFIDYTLWIERNQKGMHREHNSARLYDCILKMYHGTDWYDHYRSLREQDKSSSSSSTTIPFLDASQYSTRDDDDWAKRLEEEFTKMRVVHIRNLGSSTSRREDVVVKGWKEVVDIVFANLSEEDRASWCVENDGGRIIRSAEDFLSRLRDNNDDHHDENNHDTSVRGYASFLMHHLPVHDENDTTDPTWLPLSTLTRHDKEYDDSSPSGWLYEDALWWFVGSNPNNEYDLKGRPEHTDAISHDATFHYQLSGCKTWLIRPNHDDDNKTRTKMQQPHYAIHCQQGDVLLIDTKAWFHQTILPPQDAPSISYARDVYMRKCGTTTASTAASATTTNTTTATTLCNMEGVYATSDISPGTIVLEESDMPDCCLHRSPTPNCQVVELGDDGSSSRALLAIEPIAAGDFFTVAESSSDEEEDSDSNSDNATSEEETTVEVEE